MKIVESKNQYFEKVVRDKNGKLVRATFCVYENAGRIKARLVKIVYLTSGEISGKVSTLSNIISKKIANKSFFLKTLLSTFNFQLLTIYSIGSKPRAPTVV